MNQELDIAVFLTGVVAVLLFVIMVVVLGILQSLNEVIGYLKELQAKDHTPSNR